MSSVSESVPPPSPQYNLASHPATGYALEHPKAEFDDVLPDEEPHAKVRLGPKSERRFIPIKNDWWQNGTIFSMMQCEHDELAMSLIRICMLHPGLPPPWAPKFDDSLDWKKHLYGALSQVMWRDRRDPYYGEYGRSFREAAALVAILDVVSGGKPGQTYIDYEWMPLGSLKTSFMDPENTMTKYLSGLGFEPAPYPFETGDTRSPRGGPKENTPTPAFCLLPQVLQDAITLYCGGTEGLAGFAMKLAPPVRWRAPSPGPFKPKEHVAYNLMVQRDRAGYVWEGDEPPRKRPRSAQK